jgi:hypothetical protein
MALEFDLSISTQLEPAQVLQILSEQLDLNLDSGQIKGDGVVIGAISKTALGQSVIEEGFGFKPTISVRFRIASTDNYEQGVLTILKATIVLMSTLKGDSVLLFNGEEVVCQRIHGKLLINQNRSIWKMSQISEITLPYELVNILSPLL